MQTETNLTKATLGEMVAFGDSWDFGATPDAQDIQIPKLWLMQPLSELVTNNLAKSGDIVDSITGTVIGKDNKVDVIVFGSYKTIQTTVDGTYEKTEAYTAEVGNLPYEEVIQGKKIHRQQIHNFYVLLADEIKTDKAFPYVVSFKGTSTPTARKLNTLIAKLRAFKKPSCAQVFSLGRTLQKNDKGSYWVWTVDAGPMSAMEEVVAAKIWVDQLKTKKAVVDDKDI